MSERVQSDPNSYAITSNALTPQSWSRILKLESWSAWRHGWLLFVGEGESGKTTLNQALQDLPFKDTRSTVGVATNTVETAALRNWVKVEGTVGEKVT